MIKLHHRTNGILSKLRMTILICMAICDISFAILVLCPFQNSLFEWTFEDLLALALFMGTICSFIDYFQI